MKILVVGSGAREHALTWKLAQSGDAVHAAPGNPGMARFAQCHAVSIGDASGLVGLARRIRADLVVIGPEAPLVAGLADMLRTERIPVFGPGREAARIEGSKTFAKELMDQAGVPTARWASFDDPTAAEEYAAKLGRAVVKADGLAAGKGVVVAQDADAARTAVRAIMRESMVGEAGSRVVVEELLDGEEVSAIALCDGERFCMLPSAQDHKRLSDDDQGPNTGGMGAYSPAPILNATQGDQIGQMVIAPVLKALAARGMPFVGALYAGIMVTSQGPKVLEFNCRFGDPETQPQLMCLKGDLGVALAAAAAGDLRGQTLKASDQIAIGVVLASHGYPSAPRMGDVIRGLDTIEQDDQLQVFHAGTRTDGENLVTAGGRVLTVCALGSDVGAARDRAYQAIARISFAGMQFRHDIGSRALGKT